MRKTTLRLLLLGSVLTALALVAQEAPLDLEGLWLRDEEASDDVEEKAREAAAASSNWGPSGPGVTFGRGGRPGSSGVVRREGDEDRYRRLALGLQVLRIDREGDELTLRNGNRETRVVYLDDRVAGDGFLVKTTARRDGDALVIETETEESLVTETLRLAADRRLVIDTSIQGGGRQTRPPGPPGRGTNQRSRSGRGGPLYQQPPVSFDFRTVYERIGDDGAVEEGGERSSPVTSEAATVVARTAEREPEHGAGAASASETSPSTDPPDTDSPAGLPPRQRGSVIRILPPPRAPGELLAGKVLIQTLTISPLIETVEFWLDDQRVARRTVPPWEVKVELADPPREQTLRVAARGRGDAELGGDELLLNRLDPPFRVRIVAIEGDPRAGVVEVSAEVSVPRKAELDRVSFFRGEELVAELSEAPFTSEVSTRGVSPTEFVRVLATLRDGRELEDVQLIQGFQFSERIDVHLMQLQVLVTDRSGAPLTDLVPSDFEIVDGGARRQVERLYPARNVALVLGLSIDSSGSMESIWGPTRGAAGRFLESTLERRDRAFLVDFDTQIRLLQPLTADKRRLDSALDRLQPRGNTALYDSILFSLLQFESEPGRRALIVLTDGFDSASQADPQRAIEFGKRLGVPVYVIAISNRNGRPADANQAMAEGTARNNMRLITGPTGGRLFQVISFEQIVRAFEQIQSELRSQYVLTYYTDRPPSRAETPKVKVVRKGAKVKTALPLDLAD